MMSTSVTKTEPFQLADLNQLEAELQARFGMQSLHITSEFALTQ